MTVQAKFLTGSPIKHVAIMSFTASLGLMAMFAVDFVDMIFISMLGQAELAAAIGYAGSILFFTTSFGIGLAIAAGALIAQSLGEGSEAAAREKAGYSLIYGFLFGSLFAATVWIYTPFLVGLVGATGETATLAIGYLKIIIPSLPIMILGIIGGAILRAYGEAGNAMYATILGGVVNAILDPLLIFTFGLGLTGAALATVAARISLAAFSLYVVNKKIGGFVRPKVMGLLGDLPPVIWIAIPAILTQLATPIGSAYVTREMAAFGEEAVAGMAVIGRLTPLAFGVVFALSGAVGPIIGQNYGAGQQDRVLRTFWDAVIFVGAFVAIMSGILFVLRDVIVSAFSATGDAQLLIYAFCGPLALLFFFNGLLFVANASFNNLGHPYYSTWTNWGRHTIGTIPFVLVGGMWFGPVGVMAGQYVGGLIFGVLAAMLAIRVMANPKQQKTETHVLQATRLTQLFHARR